MKRRDYIMLMFFSVWTIAVLGADKEHKLTVNISHLLFCLVLNYEFNHKSALNAQPESTP